MTGKHGRLFIHSLMSFISPTILRSVRTQLGKMKSLYLLYFVLPPFEDNGLLFWAPDVLS